MSNLNHTALIFFTLLFLVAACSPEPVFRLAADDEWDHDSMMYSGMEYLYSDGEKSGVMLAYYRHIGDRVILDLEVSNYSDEIIRFSPETNVAYEAYSKRFDVDAGVDKGQWLEDLVAEGRAFDPERALLNIDQNRSRAEASERTRRVLNAVGETAIAAGEISSDDQTRETRAIREQRRTNRAIGRAERREQFYRTASSLNASRTYWETETIRVTDLGGGDSIAGEISLPVQPDARIVQITVEVGGEEHLFRYIQRKYQP